MGLDSYLHLHYSKRLNEDGKTLDSYLINKAKWDDFGCSNLVTLIKTVAYWRKENAIHRFFVEQLNNGKDDCGEYLCERSILVDLRKRCLDILHSIDGLVVRVPKKFVSKFKEENQWLKENNKDTFIQRVKVSFPEEDIAEFDKTIDKLTYYHVLSEPQAKQAVKLLPTQDGFFFGNTDYNGWYLAGLVKTIKMIDRALSMFETEDGAEEFYYHASW